MNGYDLVASIINSVASLAWPIAVVGIVYFFRKKLTEILPLFRFKHKETEFSFQQVQSAEDKKLVSLQADDPHPLQTVNDELKKIQSDLNNVEESSKIQALSKSLAIAQVGRNFESIFSVIFQGQIDFLRILERTKLSSEDAKRFVEGHLAQVGIDKSDMDFEKWVIFPIGEGLFTNGYEFSITQKGKDFLRFVDIEKSGIIRPL